MKKIKRVFVIICAAMLATVLSSCWDSKELDDLAIPLVGAIDLILDEEKNYTDDKYLVTVGIPVFYEEVKDKFHIISSTGRIIGETRGRRNTELGEQVIYGQLQMLLLGQELAKKENLIELIDIITRDTSVKASLYLIVVKGRAVELMKRPIHAYPNIGEYLRKLLKNSKKNNFYPYTTLYAFNRDIITYETAAILPHVIYNKGEITLSGCCLINKDKVMAELGREETETLVMLRGIKCQGALSFEAVKDGKIIDQATFQGSNNRVVTIQKQEGKYIFNILIKLDGVITEHLKQIPMEDGEDLLKIFKESLEQHIKARAESIVEKTQKEFKFDALSLANYIKAHTREKLTKEDIDRIISEAEINVEVKAHIRSAGGKT